MGETTRAIGRRLLGTLVAQAVPAEEVEFFYNSTTTVSIRVRGGEIESFERNNQRGVGVRVIRGDRTGHAWTTMVNDGGIAQAVEAARRNSLLVSAAPDTVLPHGPGVVDDSMYDPGINTAPDAVKIAMAQQLELATAGIDGVIGHDYCQYEDTVASTVVVNSCGLQSTATRSRCAIDVVAIAERGQVRQTGYGHAAARTHEDLDPAVASRRAAEELRLFDAPPERVPSGTCDVVFAPRLVSVILAHIGRALSVDGGFGPKSSLAELCGQQLGDSTISLTEDRTDPAAPGALAIDAEGVPTRAVDLVTRGRLTGLLRGDLPGLKVRNGFRGLPIIGARALAIVEDAATAGPATGLPRLLGQVDDGILAMFAPDPFSGFVLGTGTFSMGVSGRRIRNGRLSGAIQNIGVSGTLHQILGSGIPGGDRIWPIKGHAGCNLLVRGLVISDGAGI